MTTPHPATPAQTAYLQSLLNTRDVPPAQRLVIQAALDNGDMNAPTASVCIEALRARPAAQPLTPGMYTRDGEIFKVQTSRTSGRLYAKVLQGTTFSYDPTALRTLTPQHRMTQQDARAHGRATGVCAICGRTLTNPVSIERGTGPKCDGRV